MIVVYIQSDDPYLTNVVVSTVTRMGSYINMSQARNLIASGRVSVDGEVLRNGAQVMRSGIREMTIGTRNVVVDLRDSESQ